MWLVLSHAFDALALRGIFGGFPEHVGDFARRTNVRLRIAVTLSIDRG